MGVTCKVPQLRFGEFSGEWVEKRLGDIGKFSAGGDLNKLDYKKEQSEKYIYPIYANGTGEGLYGYATTFQYEQNCVTVSGRGSLGYAKVRTRKFNAIVRLIVIQPYKDINVKFLEELINKTHFAVESTGVPQLTVPQISSYKLQLPSLKEQTKIASFLSAIDSRIEQLAKKEQLLREYKKGVMQKIFSQELRFKDDDGSAFPEWVESKLGNYGKLLNGLTYSPDNMTDNGLLVLRSSNIQNQQIVLNDNVYVDLEVSSEALIQETDILICVRNGSKRLIGKSVIITKGLEKATHGAFMTVFRGKSNKFIAHWFQTPIFYKEVHKNLGATINSINTGNLKNFKTIFPSSEKEQTKIANFLSSLDTKIEQTSKELKLTKEFKKALLQKMFV